MFRSFVATALLIRFDRNKNHLTFRFMFYASGGSNLGELNGLLPPANLDPIGV
jgi:hypothetical protein